MRLNVSSCARTATGVLVAVMTGAASAGPITIANFSGSETVTTFSGLGLPSSNSAPGVFDGNTYTTNSGNYWYWDFSPYGCNGECFIIPSDTGFVDVVLSAAATRVGALVGYNVGGTGFAEFFNSSNALLGTVVVAGFAFAGWEDSGGISRFRYTDTASNLLVSMLDDFRFEGAPDGGHVPEPLSLALAALGLAGLALQQRQRNKAA